MTSNKFSTQTGSPWLWAGSMIAGYGAAAALHISGAVEGGAAWILYLVPLALIWPLYRSLARRAQGKPNGKYFSRMMGLMSAYLVFLFIAEKLLDTPDPLTGPGAILVAILPGIPVIGVFWAIGRLLVDTTDEYQRMLLVRQILVGTALALAAATAWGFLEFYGIVVHVDAFWWAILFFLGQGLGGLVNKLTYGDFGPCS
ncbi:MAG: hypothetical protein ABJ045_12410 [Alteripontixanthobacter sp.]